MKRILACIDASSYAARVSDLTAWAAKRLTASVEILHVVQRKDAQSARQDLSGAIGLGVKSSLLEELTRIDEMEGKLAIERGRILLDSVQEKLNQAGVGVVVATHRHGGIVETVAEREVDADLVIIGKRGASSEFATDHIGSKVERVIRASKKPVLIASRDGADFDGEASGGPSTAVLAYDGSPASNKALHFMTESALFEGTAIHVVIAGPDDARHRKLEEAASEKLAGRTPTRVIVRREGSAEAVISAYMADHKDGMLVMGAYGHSPLRTLIVGSTTTSMIRTVHVPILLMRP